MFVFLLWIKEAFIGLFRNFWWNSVAFLLSFVCLVAFSVSYAAGGNAEQFSKMLNERLEIQVDLKANAIDYSKIEQGIMMDSRVKEVEFISKEDAQKKMKDELGKDSAVLSMFSENIFPASFIVKLNDVSEIESVAKDIQSKGYAERVIYGKEYIEKLLIFTDKFQKGGVYATIVGSIFVVFLVMFIIRMNIEQRKDEIRIKQLFGSSMFTVRMPFVLEALLLMAAASASAYYCFIFLYRELQYFISREIPYLTIVDSIAMQQNIMVPLFGLALLLGFFGSIFAANKHLKRL